MPWSLPLMARLVQLLVAFFPLLGAAQAPVFPTWLWNAPAQWAFSPDQLKLDMILNGYRVWCWTSWHNPDNAFGLYVRGDVKMEDMRINRLTPLNSDSCKALIRAYGG